MHAQGLQLLSSPPQFRRRNSTICRHRAVGRRWNDHIRLLLDSRSLELELLSIRINFNLSLSDFLANSFRTSCSSTVSEGTTPLYSCIDNAFSSVILTGLNCAWYCCFPAASMVSRSVVREMLMTKKLLTVCGSSTMTVGVSRPHCTQWTLESDRNPGNSKQLSGLGVSSSTASVGGAVGTVQ